jgi:hypothetical protein
MQKMEEVDACQVDAKMPATVVECLTSHGEPLKVDTLESINTRIDRLRFGAETYQHISDKKRMPSTFSRPVRLLLTLCQVPLSDQWAEPIDPFAMTLELI